MARGDDLALGQERGDAGVDQAGAKLVEEQDRGDQQQKRGEVQDDDAPRQAGEDVDGGEVRDTAQGATEQACARRGAASTSGRSSVPAVMARRSALGPPDHHDHSLKR